MKNQTVRIFATSDLVTDQRVDRIASSLNSIGYKIIVTGRKSTTNLNHKPVSYEIKKIGTYFKKGMLFYISYNIKIFFSLLFSRYSLIYANDLDTLPGCCLASVIRFKPLIYDSHELFPDVPELIGHPIKRIIWKTTERICVRKAKKVITVSDGVANELKRRYKLGSTVIRNFPIKKEVEAFKDKRPTLIYQGSLNVGRGVELAIDMMNYLSCYRLIIAGTGDIEIDLRKRMLDQKLFDRIEFTGRLTPSRLHTLTCTAWLGLSLEEDKGLNYRYALPNKIFDYINAQVPVLVSDLPEMRKVIDDYGVGLVATTRNPQELANLIADFFENKKAREEMEQKVQHASTILNWENEKTKLVDLVSSVLN